MSDVGPHAGLLRTLVPAFIATSETRQRVDPSTLLELEHVAVRDAGPVRRAEFAAGRECARDALRRIGLSASPIAKAANGAPSWPTSVVGSITHCKGFAAAAVGFASQVRTIGIDAEPHADTREGVLQRIASVEELDHLEELSSNYPNTHWDRLLFSAKEATFKAWFPQTRFPLRFRDATIGFSADGVFTARVAPNEPTRSGPCVMSGRWLVSDIVLTAVFAPNVRTWTVGRS